MDESDLEPTQEIVTLRLDDGTIVHAVASVYGGEEEVAVDLYAFDNILDTLRGIAGTVSTALGGSGARKTAVEFSLELAVESGKLVAVIGKGSARASIKVILEWAKQG